MGCQSCCGTSVFKDCAVSASDAQRRPEVQEFISIINLRLDEVLKELDTLRGRLSSVLREVPEEDTFGKIDPRRTSTCEIGHQLSNISDRIDSIQYGIKTTLERLEV